MLSLKTKELSPTRDVVQPVCREICLSFSRAWLIHTKRSRETPLRAWLPGRSERQFSVPRGIRVQFLHELVAPIRHDLSTSPGRAHSTRKAREQSSTRKAPHFHASRCLQRHNHSYGNAPTGCFHAGAGAGPACMNDFSGKISTH